MVINMVFQSPLEFGGSLHTSINTHQSFSIWMVLAMVELPEDQGLTGGVPLVVVDCIIVLGLSTFLGACFQNC